MQILTFTGRAFPSAQELTFVKKVAINWRSADLGSTINTECTITDSLVEVVCMVPNFKQEDFGTLLHLVSNLLEGITDLLSFATGIAMSATIDSAILPDGHREDIWFRDRSLEGLCTAFKVPMASEREAKDFDEALILVLGEPALLESLRDLTDIIHSFNITPTNCGRVLDSLRKAVSPGRNKRKGWIELRNIVNTDEMYMTWISDLSNEFRHGDRTAPIPGSVIRELRIRTWTIMNRFVEYRKSGSVALDKTKFPLLTHDPSFAFSLHSRLVPR